MFFAPFWRWTLTIAVIWDLLKARPGPIRRSGEGGLEAGVAEQQVFAGDAFQQCDEDRRLCGCAAATSERFLIAMQRLRGCYFLNLR